ncbi:hypothetical protein Hanom_Chr04g00367831 [Helianthus anomalus]
MLAVGGFALLGVEAFDPRIKGCALWTRDTFAAREFGEAIRDVTLYCSRTALSQLPGFQTWNILFSLGHTPSSIMKFVYYPSQTQ